jgi:thioredoxin
MTYVIEPDSTEQARTILGNAETPVLVDFSATWCGPCKAFAPVLEEFAASRAESLKVVKIDVDQFNELAREVGIRSVPTIMVVKDGAVLAAQAGSLPRSALAQFVDSALA